jgi:hypothetical protein
LICPGYADLRIILNLPDQIDQQAQHAGLLSGRAIERLHNLALYKR